MRTHRAALAVVLLAATGAAHAEAPPPVPDLGRELARLNATLSDIRSLLERQLETQNLDLLMKRMELAAAQVSDAESRLGRAAASLESLEEESAALTDRLAVVEAELLRGDAEGDPGAMAGFVAQLESTLERIEDRLRDKRLEIAGLENLLASKERDLRDWQELLDRRLANP